MNPAQQAHEKISLDDLKLVVLEEKDFDRAFAGEYGVDTGARAYLENPAWGYLSERDRCVVMCQGYNVPPRGLRFPILTRLWAWLGRQREIHEAGHALRIAHTPGLLGFFDVMGARGLHVVDLHGLREKTRGWPRAKREVPA